MKSMQDTYGKSRGEKVYYATEQADKNGSKKKKKSSKAPAKGSKY